MSSFIQGAGTPGTPRARARRARAIVFPPQRGLREDSPPTPPPAPRPQQSGDAPAHLAGRSLPARLPPTCDARNAPPRGPRGLAPDPRAAPRLPGPARGPARLRAPHPARYRRWLNRRAEEAPGRSPPQTGRQQRSRGRLRHPPEKGLEQSHNTASPGTTTPGMPRPRADYISQKAAGRAPGDALSLPLGAPRTRCPPPLPTPPSAPGGPRQGEGALKSKANGLFPVLSVCIPPGAYCARPAR